MITVVILKPTKACNASCTYCSAPPDGEPKWSYEDFTRLFDRLAPHLHPMADLIWHGGEPMLMGPDFYRRAWDYAQARRPGIRFSMQTNLLGYALRWRPIMQEVFQGQISTSFDPDERYREYKGSTRLYTRLFMDRLEQFLDDGFRPLVIGTYTEETAPQAHSIYDRALAMGERCFSMRVNYRYPVGRSTGTGEVIRPVTYGRILLDLWERWISDAPYFAITPLDQMLRRVLVPAHGQCPWIKGCGGHFLGINPNFDVYNCSEFADLGDPAWRFGNLMEQTVPELMASKAALAIRRRRIETPLDCQGCRHFAECEGGCMRDAVLYDHGLYGKFHYCQSWKMVWDRIKTCIRTGEADSLLLRLGFDGPGARRRQGLPALPGDDTAAAAVLAPVGAAIAAA